MKLDIRVGTVLTATLNDKARKPAYVLEIDFGELGTKITSAQITENYTPESLIGRQVIAIVNFPEKMIASVRSQVLVLASVDSTMGTILLAVERTVPNGSRVL